MPKPVPIYRAGGEMYYADTCEPLIEASQRGEVTLSAVTHGHYPGKRLPQGELPGLKTIGFWHAALDQTWALAWHRNEGLELTFLETGRLTFDVDDRCHVLKPGDLTITRPWQRHRVGYPNVTTSRLHWLILDLEVRRPNQVWKWPSWLLLSRADRMELTTMLRHCEQPVWSGSADIRRVFRAISHAIEADRKGSHLSRLAILMNELFVSLLDLFRGQNIELNASLSGSHRTVQLFLQDLQSQPEHLELEWNVQDMAAACGLGVTRFVHHVRTLTNMTPIEFLNRCRLEHAARVLREQPGVSITEVALTSGFTSSQYFATLFSRHFGRSPRQFRQLAG